MILRRIGNKKRLLQKIISFFPKHEIYIEPFFGAGGIFFSKPLAKLEKGKTKKIEELRY